VNRAETVLDYPETGVTWREPLNQDAAVINFPARYAREPPGLIWFVLSRGADARRVTDVAPAVLAEAFAVRERIRTCSRSRLHFERASHVEVRRKHRARGQDHRRDS